MLTLVLKCKRVLRRSVLHKNMAAFGRWTRFLCCFFGFSFIGASFAAAVWFCKRRRQPRRISSDESLRTAEYLSSSYGAEDDKNWNMELVQNFRFRYNEPSLISQMVRIPFEDGLHPDTSFVWSLEETDTGNLLLVKNNLLREESVPRLVIANAPQRRHMAVCKYRNYFLFALIPLHKLLIYDDRSGLAHTVDAHFDPMTDPWHSFRSVKYLFATAHLVCLVSTKLSTDNVDIRILRPSLRNINAYSCVRLQNRFVGESRTFFSVASMTPKNEMRVFICNRQWGPSAGDFRLEVLDLDSLQWSFHKRFFTVQEFPANERCLLSEFVNRMCSMFRDVTLPLWTTSGCVVADSKIPRQVFLATRYGSWKSLWYNLKEAFGPEEFSPLFPHVPLPTNPVQLYKTNLQPATLKTSAVNALTKNFPNLKHLSVGQLKELGIPERIAETMAEKEEREPVVVDLEQHEQTTQTDSLEEFL